MAGEAAFPERAEPTRGDAAWQLLDERDEWLEFSRPVGASAGDAEQGVWESNVVFEGMHCAACAVTIEQALRATPGVREADISAAAHRGRVVWDESATKPSDWMQAVLRTGYRPLPASDAFAAERRQAETRKMMWRLGVAGVCMMQVMMYATPEYFTSAGDMEADTVRLLRWAQWVLSIPVVLFSCQPFFRNAWLDLKLRRVSMDLPVALGMLITFVVSSLGTFEPQGVFGHQVYFDSLTMFVFFLLTGRWLELRLRDRTAGALEALDAAGASILTRGSESLASAVSSVERCVPTCLPQLGGGMVCTMLLISRAWPLMPARAASSPISTPAALASCFSSAAASPVPRPLPASCWTNC